MTAALRQAHRAVEQLVLQLHLILVKLTKLELLNTLVIIVLLLVRGCKYYCK